PGAGKQIKRAAAGLERARARAAQAPAKAAAKAAARNGPGPVRNTTDQHSRLMPTRHGFIQGYNTQNVTSADGLIIATALPTDPADTAWFEPIPGHAQAPGAAGSTIAPALTTAPAAPAGFEPMLAPAQAAAARLTARHPGDGEPIGL